MSASIIKRLSAGYIPEPNSGCWLWLGATNNKGYGQIRINRKTFLAHRTMLSIGSGQSGDGLNACHKCDVPLCINPEHLFWGTQSENIRDGFRKGRIIPHNSLWKSCKAGHPYTAQSTRISKDGKRRCRVCENIRMKRNYWKNPELARARVKKWRSQ